MQTNGNAGRFSGFSVWAFPGKEILHGPARLGAFGQATAGTRSSPTKRRRNGFDGRRGIFRGHNNRRHLLRAGGPANANRVEPCDGCDGM